MPHLPARACAHCGGNHRHGTTCQVQKRERTIWDLRRGTPTERGYDKHHRVLRVQCFLRDAWRCVECGWRPPIVEQFSEFGLGVPPTEAVLAELTELHRRGERHLDADHEIPISDRPELRLSLDNYRTRCDRCHKAKTLREANEGGRVSLAPPKKFAAN